MSKFKIAILASGSGTNAEAIIKYFTGHADIEVAIVLSNNPNAFVLQRAAKLGIKSATFSREEFQNNEFIQRHLDSEGITHIVLAGFLWLVPGYLVSAYKGRVVNIHPALLPKYGGKGMYGMRVHEAVKNACDTKSGITIHEVDEIYDHGKVLKQYECVVEPTDTPESIAEKIHELEYTYYPPTIEKWILES